MRVLGIRHIRPYRGGPDREYVALMVDRGLKSGKLDQIELTDQDLLRLIAEAAGMLRMRNGGGS